MATRFTGGCMCGAIRYECSAEPVAMVNCHCRDCQRAAGSAFAPEIIVLRSAVTITGDLTYYDVTGETGNITSRAFCPTCGARLFTKAALLPEHMEIMAGSLDDPSWFRPGMDTYTASAQPWDCMNPELPKFPKLPPMQ